MSDAEDTHIPRLTELVRGTLHPPPGHGRILLALTFGGVAVFEPINRAMWIRPGSERLRRTSGGRSGHRSV